MVKHVARAALRGVVLFVVVGLVGGCAGYKIQENGSGCGYDVYAPEPYLLATPSVVPAAGNQPATVIYTFAIQWLPNYSKRYRISSWAGLGKADFTFKFTDGWQLVSIDDKSDNTKIVDALAGLAKQLLPTDAWGEKALGVAPQGDPLIVCPAPILYRIDFDADGRPACLTELNIRSPACPQAGAFPLHPPCR